MRIEAREQAYVEFVAARQTHLRRIAYAVCGDWQQADDLLQVALTKLYVAWPRVWRLGTEEAYVRRLIIRTRVDERPGLRRRWSAPCSDPPAETGDRTPLFAALQSLPETRRKIVILRHWLGLSVEETAEELGMSRQSVRSHAERGLASVEGALTREDR
jgi:DNA-directed RNA polymerase specialized sigma24 family protein